MKLTIEGTEEEIKNTLQAISGSKERDELRIAKLSDDFEPIRMHTKKTIYPNN
ncbi:hypothetical protein [Weissella minor]|uniref:Uncharacterized protein n=1 Tax=Weissella minor TaxID=1620 RepID=A0A0R2JIW6_9LACO|nr:hypothetical protein [Weissella minor]KRN77235.1 hypothetical protein IV67_GL000020 [Weissella minor]